MKFCVQINPLWQLIPKNRNSYTLKQFIFAQTRQKLLTKPRQNIVQ